MLVEGQIVEVKWNRQNKKKYVQKGYKFTNYGDVFFVDANDLNKSDKTKVRAICDYCGNEYDVIFQNYYKNITDGENNACQHCVGSKSAEATLVGRQDAIYQALQKKLVDKGYTLLTPKQDIKNTADFVEYMCTTHGITKSRINHILYHDCGCKECGKITGSIKRNESSLADRQNYLYQKIMERCRELGYVVLTKKEDITCNADYIDYVCKIHGNHKMRIYNFLSGKMCPECALDNAAERYRLPISEVEFRINKLGGTVLNANEYKRYNEKNLKILCFECNRPFITSLGCFEEHGGQVCPDCSDSESIGEKKVRHYLEDHKIEFISQKWFVDCKDKRPLPFDFYIPKYNTIIEFDGRQHFSETNYFTYSFEETKKHDEIKNNYCKENGIYLIRIPYWNIDKIEQILEHELILS